MLHIYIYLNLLWRGGGASILYDVFDLDIHNKSGLGKGRGLFVFYLHIHKRYLGCSDIG